MQEQLIHSEKLASLGQLAAGVAHELNTPLANITLITENLLRKNQDEYNIKKLHTISEQVDSIARIVKSLLDFSRKSESSYQNVNVNDLLGRTVELIKGIRHSEVQVLTEYSTDIPPIDADPGKLQQVFSNLITNAYDAMESGGALTIRTEFSAKNNIVSIQVVDTGSGIPESHINKIFDPFYSTKPTGKGTGLGLSICHGIITAHGGTIHVVSEEGKGSTFVITLPTGDAA